MSIEGVDLMANIITIIKERKAAERKAAMKAAKKAKRIATTKNIVNVVTSTIAGFAIPLLVEKGIEIAFSNTSDETKYETDSNGVTRIKETADCEDADTTDNVPDEITIEETMFIMVRNCLPEDELKNVNFVKFDVLGNVKKLEEVMIDAIVAAKNEGRTYAVTELIKCCGIISEAKIMLSYEESKDFDIVKAIIKRIENKYFNI